MEHEGLSYRVGIKFAWVHISHAILYYLFFVSEQISFKIFSDFFYNLYIFWEMHVFVCGSEQIGYQILTDFFTVCIASEDELLHIILWETVTVLENNWAICLFISRTQYGDLFLRRDYN